MEAYRSLRTEASVQAVGELGSPTERYGKGEQLFPILGLDPGIIHEKAGLIITKFALCRPFGWNRHPAGSKKSLNSTNWGHDLRRDRAELLEMEKKPCFYLPIRIYSRRVPTEILSSVMGMQRVCSEWGDAP